MIKEIFLKFYDILRLTHEGILHIFSAIIGQLND